MADKDIVIKISADGKDVQAELNNINKSAGKLNKSLSLAAKGAAVAFTALTAAAADSVREFIKFESGFSNVITLLDKGSFKTKEFKQGVDDMRAGLLDLSAQTGQSFDVLNKGLFDIVSAGVDAEKAIEALAAASNLAIAGATDTSVAVDGITSALNAYGLAADEAESISQKFFTAQKFGKTTVEELATGYGKVSATAASMNISLDEVLGSVSAVTLGGTRTSEAFTGLQATFANVIRPTKEAQEEAKRLGIEFNTTALRSLGLKGFLDQITESAGFNSKSIETLFSSVEALRFVQSAAGGQSEDFADQLKALGDETQVASTFADALATKQDTLDFQMGRAKQSVNALKVAIGEQLAPTVGDFADEITDMSESVRKNEQAIRDFGDAALFVFRAIKSALAGLVAEFDNFGKMIAGLYESTIGVAREIAARGAGRIAGVLDFVGADGTADRLRGFASEQETLARMNAINTQSIGIQTPGAGFVGAITSEFGEQDIEPEEKREQELESAREHEEAKREVEAEGRLNRQEDALAAEEIQAEKDVEKRELELEAKALRIEEDLQIFRDARQTRYDILAKFLGLENKIAEKSTKDKNKKINAIEEQANKEREAIFNQNLAHFENSLTGMIKSGTAASKAMFLINKALAIAEILNNAQRAAAQSRAVLAPFGEPEAQRQLAMGYIAAASVGASALVGLPAAQQGGIVPGTGRGDKTLMALEPGEMIIPRQQIRPTFGEIFNNLEGEEPEGEARETIVTIGFTDEASRFLTLQQREDSKLGIAR